MSFIGTNSGNNLYGKKQWEKNSVHKIFSFQIWNLLLNIIRVNHLFPQLMLVGCLYLIDIKNSYRFHFQNFLNALSFDVDDVDVHLTYTVHADALYVTGVMKLMKPDVVSYLYLQLVIVLVDHYLLIYHSSMTWQN